MNNNQKKSFEYENLGSLLIGAWVLFSPMIGGLIPTYRGLHVYWWNFIIVGLAVVFMSILSIRKMVAWAERVNIIAGVWLMVAPLFLIYFNQSSFYFWNSVISGGAIAFLSALALPIADHVIYHKHVLSKKDREPLPVLKPKNLHHHHHSV